MILISEIGNCHFGSMKKAKELIKASIDSGADLVKGQAFLAEDIDGSMPIEFYKKCQFDVSQLKELIDYAQELGKDMFFSIFSKGFNSVAEKQNYMKIAAMQTAKLKNIHLFDLPGHFISIPTDYKLEKKMKYAKIMVASKYFDESPPMARVKEEFVDGYSDHTRGIGACVEASINGATVIEKHFTLEKDLAFLRLSRTERSVFDFRDTQHGATPEEFEQLANIIKQ